MIANPAPAHFRDALPLTPTSPSFKRFCINSTGTYSPSFRLIYGLAGPPAPAVVAAAHGALQLAALLAALLASRWRVHGQSDSAQRVASKPEHTGPSCCAELGDAQAGAAAGEPSGPEAAALSDLEEPLLPKGTARTAGDAAAAGSDAAAIAATTAAAAVSTAAPSAQPPARRDLDSEQPVEVRVEDEPPPQQLRQIWGLPPAVVAALELG